MLKSSILMLANVMLVLGICNAATIDELVASQRSAMQAEANKKAGAASQEAGVLVASTVKSAQTNVEHGKVDDLRLIAVYGVNRNLTADIFYNGAVFSVVQGGEAVEGWRAESITSSRVVLTHFAGGKKQKQKQHVIYLSDPTTNTSTNAAVGTGVAIPSAIGGGVPMIRPFPTASIPGPVGLSESYPSAPVSIQPNALVSNVPPGINMPQPSIPNRSTR